MDNKLTQLRISELIFLHKSLKNKSDADKIKCIILHEKGWTWEAIKEALLIGEHFIHNTLKDYNNGGVDLVLKNNYKGNNFKMTKEQEKKLSDFVENNFVVNAKVACEYVKKNFNITYTNDGMVLTLKRLGFRYKKPKIVPGKIPGKDVQKDFAIKSKEILNNLSKNESLYYLDGAGLVHNVKNDYGWIKKGKDKIIKTNTGRQKININGAYNPLTNETICIEQEGSEAVNQQSNILLIDKIISKNPGKKKIYIILDNAPSNKGSLFIQHLKTIKDIKIELIYLPAYCPNLNLIERLWKYSKKILLSIYYEKFKDFKIRVIDFFEKEILNVEHRECLKTFIGKEIHIIDV